MRYFKIFLFITSLLVALNRNVSAQSMEYVFENIGIEQGLSQSSVSSALQDSKGFLWFSTQDGLNRYDGYNFKIFRPNFENSKNSISEGFINSIVEDSNGNILIGTFSGGFDLYDQKNEKFYNFHHDPKNKNSIEGLHVLNMILDGKNDLWVITDKGFSKIHFPIRGRYDTVVVSNTKSLMRKPFVFWQNPDMCIEPDMAGNLLFKYKNRCYYISKKDVDYEKIDPDHFEKTASRQFDATSVLCFARDRNKNIWVVYPDRMEKIEPNMLQKPQVIRFGKEFKTKTNRTIFAGSDSCLYYGEYGSLFFSSFNTKTGVITPLTNDPTNPKSIISNDVNVIFEDTNGNIWFGAGNGISKYNSKKTKFTHVYAKPGNNDWIQDRWPFAFSEDAKGQIWIGVYKGNGIYVYNKTTNKFKLITPTDAKSVELYSEIMTIFKDSENKMWVGSLRAGLGYFDEKKNQFNFLQKGDAGRLFIRCIREDKEGFLWLATAYGIVKYDKRNNKFNTYLPSAVSNDFGNPLNAFRWLTIEDDGTIWLGSDASGLFRLRFDRDGKPVFKQYTSINADSTTLSSNQIFSVEKAADGKLWVSTNGAGLNLFDPKTEKCRRYSMKSGLSNNVVYGTLLDKKNRVWASTNYGLSMLDPKTQKFKNFTVNQGLQSNEFNQGAFFCDASGLMYFGGVRGYNVFDPMNIQVDSSLAKVVFTDFKLFNQSVQPGEASPIKQSIAYASVVNLNYDQRDFTFEFAATHYASPDDNQFAYMIEGIHSDWLNLGNNHSVSFTNFPHGEYVLKVKASNADGVWGNEYASVKIVIKPPFWKTNLFYTLVALFLIILTIVLVKWRERKLIYEKILLEKKVDERTLTIREQNEELRVQKEEIMAQSEELETINEQLEKLSLVASKTDNAVIIMDHHGNVEWVNEGFTKLYGFTQESFVNTRGLNIKQNSAHPDIAEILDSCIQNKRTVSYESQMISISDGVLWAQTTLTPILDENYQITKLVAIDSDITKQKAAETRINFQNKQITDSIQYARRIQSAIMPPDEMIYEFFPQSFILFEPRDIVSGDFYWANQFWCEKTESQKVVVAVADCTGHGVPGAFMSMLGIAFLNEIVGAASKNNIETTASHILEEMKSMLIKSLHQTGKSRENKDGMDISLCIIDLQTKDMQFAGANNSLFVARNNELLELKADKMPVGIYMGDEKKFTNHRFELLKGDCLYLFSDGYQDQFGGPAGRKFLKKNLKALLLDISKLKPEDQKQQLKASLQDWLSAGGQSFEQLDDITVMGLTIE